MSDGEETTTHVADTDAAGVEAGDWWNGEDPFEFMGFDMNISRQELLETVDAWRDLIKRFSRDAEKDQRAADLVTRTRLRCGVACCVLEDWPQAITDLEAVRDEQDAHPSLVQAATWMLSAVYAAQGQYEQAIACWSAILAAYEAAGAKKASALPAKVTILYLLRGQVYAEQGKFAEAVDDCNRAEHYHPECAEVFSVRALARANLGDMDRALADCDRSIELEPRMARGFRRRGTVHRMRREFMPAVSDFDQALELDPTDEHARTGRSEALLGYVMLDLLAAPPAQAATTEAEQEPPEPRVVKGDPTETVESAN